MAQQLREVMTPDPIVLPVTAPMMEAAQRMRDEDIGDVLVEDNGKLCGMCTDRDMVVRAIAEGLEPRTTPVGNVCSREIVALSPDDLVEDAIRLMREHAVRRMPVVEDGRPVGMISLGDLAIDRDFDSALAEISAAPPNN